jgi:hypothetical protein
MKHFLIQYNLLILVFLPFIFINLYIYYFFIFNHLFLKNLKDLIYLIILNLHFYLISFSNFLKAYFKV